MSKRLLRALMTPFAALLFAIAYVLFKITETHPDKKAAEAEDEDEDERIRLEGAAVPGAEAEGAAPDLKASKKKGGSA